MVDWAAIRKEFPAASTYVYFKAGSGGILSRPAAQACTSLYEDWSEHGDVNFPNHEKELCALKCDIADLLNVRKTAGEASEQIALTTNTSDGMNFAAFLATQNGKSCVDVVALWNEFPSVTLPWVNKDARLHMVSQEDTEQHGVHAAIANKLHGLQGQVRCLAISHVSFVDGVRTDLISLGELCGELGAFFVVDVSQSFGVFSVDVQAARIDAVVCNGYKWLCAGYGGGFAYLSQRLMDHHVAAPAVGWHNVLDESINDRFELQSGAARFMDGAPPFPGLIALRASLQFFQSIGWTEIAARVLSLNRRLATELTCSGYAVDSPLKDSERSGNLILRMQNPDAVATALKERGIIVKSQAHGLRISTHIFNDESDIDKLLAALLEIAPPPASLVVKDLCLLCDAMACPSMLRDPCVLHNGHGILVLFAGAVKLPDSGHVVIRMELQHSCSIQWAENLTLVDCESEPLLKISPKMASKDTAVFEWSVAGIADLNLQRVWKLYNCRDHPLGICVVIELEVN